MQRNCTEASRKNFYSSVKQCNSKKNSCYASDYFWQVLENSLKALAQGKDVSLALGNSPPTQLNNDRSNKSIQINYNTINIILKAVQPQLKKCFPWILNAQK